MTKKKIVMILLIILAILLLAFVGNTIRKMIILDRLNRLMNEQQLQEGNQYYHMQQIKDDNLIFSAEIYTLDSSHYKTVMEIQEYHAKMTTIQKGTKLIEYNDYEKTMSVSEVEEYVPKDSYSSDYDLLERISDGVFSTISSTTIDGKECYKIIGVNSLTSSFDDAEQDPPLVSIVYVEKDTGLIIRIEQVTDDAEHKTVQVFLWEYQFDCVTQDDLTELDASEYTLIEENNDAYDDMEETQ